MDVVYLATDKNGLARWIDACDCRDIAKVFGLADLVTVGIKDLDILGGGYDGFATSNGQTLGQCTGRYQLATRTSLTIFDYNIISKNIT